MTQEDFPTTTVSRFTPSINFILIVFAFSGGTSAGGGFFFCFGRAGVTVVRLGGGDGTVVRPGTGVVPAGGTVVLAVGSGAPGGGSLDVAPVWADAAAAPPEIRPKASHLANAPGRPSSRAARPAGGKKIEARITKAARPAMISAARIGLSTGMQTH